MSITLTAPPEMTDPGPTVDYPGPSYVRHAGRQQ